MRRRAIAVLIAAGVVAGATVAVPAGSTAAVVPAVRLDQLGAQIRHLGETGLANLFAGVRVDEAAGVVRLQVTAHGAAEQALRALAGAVPVVTTVVPRSFGQLMRMQHAVIDDSAMWTSRGAVITQVGPDAETDRLIIGVAAYTDGLATALGDRYGAQNIEVQQVDAGSGTADRSHDSAPWNGGDTIKSSTGATCTSGFGVHASNSSTTATGPWLVTAGHCYANGTTVKNNGKTMGQISRASNLYTDYGDDVEIILASSSKYIWETNTARARGDGAIEGPAVGSTICHSGAATNKRCGVVQQINQCFLNNDNNLHFCSQDLVTSSSLLGAGGDSGGPWFDAYTLSNVRYESAIGVQSLGWNFYTCSTQIGTNTKCTKKMSYTELDEIARAYNIWPNS